MAASPADNFQCAPIITREEWGAEPAVKTEPAVHPFPNVYFSFDTELAECSTKEECIEAVQTLQLRHKQVDKSDDIKYNFLIGGDGCVYEGRGFHVKPCPSLILPGHKEHRMDIGFIGSFLNYDMIPHKMALAGYDIAQHGMNQGFVAEFYSYNEINKVEPTPKPYKSMEDAGVRNVLN